MNAWEKGDKAGNQHSSALWRLSVSLSPSHQILKKTSENWSPFLPSGRLYFLFIHNDCNCIISITTDCEIRELRMMSWSRKSAR